MADKKPESMKVRELFMVTIGVAALCAAYWKHWYIKGEAELVRERHALEEAASKLKDDEKAIQDLLQVAKGGEAGTPQDEKIRGIRDANKKFTNIIRALFGAEDPQLFTIRKLEVENEEKFQGYSKVLFSLEVEAPFLHVGQFLEKLEKSKLLTELLRVEASRIDPELKRCQIKLRLYSYVSRI